MPFPFMSFLKKWEPNGQWECDLDSLRDKVGAIPKSYSVYGNFKKKALEPSIKEINEKTDLQITYEEVKKGRKVESIKFYIKSKVRQKDT